VSKSGAITLIQGLRKEFWSDVRITGKANEMNPELEKALRVIDALEMGELTARDALAREESCGGHFREEYQTEEGEAKRDDEKFMHVAAWQYNGDNAEPTRHTEVLNYEFIHVATRNYK
jgi:succinate dehydrogenase / fumarate reductase flavoprotein subunit